MRGGSYLIHSPWVLATLVGDYFTADVGRTHRPWNATRRYTESRKLTLPRAHCPNTRNDESSSFPQTYRTISRSYATIQITRLFSTR